MTTLFGFNVLEEYDPILKDNDWKTVWMHTYDFWYPMGVDTPDADRLEWLQNVPTCPPVVSKISNGDRHDSGVMKILVRPEDYVLYVLKFE